MAGFAWSYELYEITVKPEVPVPVAPWTGIKRAYPVGRQVLRYATARFDRPPGYPGTSRKSRTLVPTLRPRSPTRDRPAPRPTTARAPGGSIDRFQPRRPALRRHRPSETSGRWRSSLVLRPAPKQLWKQLEQARRDWATQPPVLVEVPQTQIQRVERDDLDGLPAGVELGPGSITLRFQEPEEALQKLMAFAMAMSQNRLAFDQRGGAFPCFEASAGTPHESDVAKVLAAVEAVLSRLESGPRCASMEPVTPADLIADSSGRSCPVRTGISRSAGGVRTAAGAGPHPTCRPPTRALQSGGGAKRGEQISTPINPPFWDSPIRDHLSAFSRPWLVPQPFPKSKIHNQ